MEEFFSRIFIAPNTLADWSWFLGIILGGLVIRALLAKVVARIIFRFFRKQDSGHIGFEKLFHLVRKPWHFLLLLVIIAIACQQLTWPPEWKMTPPQLPGLRMVLQRSLLFLTEFSVTWLMLRLADFLGLLLHARAVRENENHEDQLVPFLRESVKVILVILSFFVVLGTVFHVNVASLIAGLGIGGIAVALAAKDSLQNLMASFTIFLDKPFSVGDVIQVGEKAGTIEKIGFRSTRIRSEDRSFITIPNNQMVENQVINLSLRTARRVKFNVGLTYDTSMEQMKKVIADIADYIEKNAKTSFGDNRVSFFEFGPSSLDIQVIYYIPDLDFDLFLKTKEEVNFALMEIVQKNGCSFAFPSQSVYIEKK